MRILVLGSGAREHAIASSLLSTGGHHVVVSPGNAGIAATPGIEIGAISDISDGDAVSQFAIDESIDLVVVGPEAPLIEGVADAPRERGIPVFGPGRVAAQIEGSKAFAKRVMEEAGVPTGRATRASSLADAVAAIDEYGAPHVVKADGLAAGKGVLVTDDRDAAIAHAKHWIAAGPVLVEEFLSGDEVSLFFLSDGHSVVPLAPAQDYKRLLDGDRGPNTGGMGAYSPLPWLNETFGSERAFVDEVLTRVALPVVRRLEDEGSPFIGLLYCGLIVDGDQIRVIEFNARFGDPETQVVLPRLTTPLADLLFSAATGGLASSAWPEFSSDVAVGVVLASEGYPEAPVTGRSISGFDAALDIAGASVAHAATIEDGDGGLTATGGRVVTVVATAADFAEARDRAYAAVREISLEGGQYRSDIAEKVSR